MHPIGHSGTWLWVPPAGYPRQDSNLRPQDYQSAYFDGSRWLSLALVAQWISTLERYQRLPLNLAAFRSNSMNKRWAGSPPILTRPTFRHADNPLANGFPFYWVQLGVARLPLHRESKVYRRKGVCGKSVGPAEIISGSACPPNGFAQFVPRDRSRGSTVRTRLPAWRRSGPRNGPRTKEESITSVEVIETRRDNHHGNHQPVPTRPRTRRRR